MNFLGRIFAAVRTAKSNANGLAALEAAYDEGAGLHGVILAFTGTTTADADNLLSAAVMESLAAGASFLAMAADTCEAARTALDSAATTAVAIAHAATSAVGTVEAAGTKLRQLQTFVERLQTEPLRSVLES